MNEINIPDSEILLEGFKKMCDALFLMNLEKQESRIFFCSEAIKDRLEKSHGHEEFVSAGISLIKPEYKEKYEAFFQLDTLEERLRNHRSIALEYECEELGWARTTIIPVTYDQQHRLKQVLIAVVLIDEEMTWKHNLIRMAQTDSMTGLLNHHSAIKQIQALLDARQSGILMLFDCDKFKNINDRCGHIVGDEYIIKISNLMQQHFPHSIVFRMGGDEFGVFVKHILTPREMADHQTIFFQQFTEVVHSIPAIGKAELKLSLSVGAVQYNGEPDIIYKDLFVQADHCLYQSKKKKGNYVTFQEKIKVSKPVDETISNIYY